MSHHQWWVGAVCGLVAFAAAACTGTATPSNPGPATVSPTSVASGSASTGTATSTTAVPGGVPNCGTGELRASLGQAGGAAGSVIVPLVLTNVGARTCELRGFPGVS